VVNLSQYDVLAIGIPKSGTNMTEKVCKMLGAIPSPHMHTANYLLAQKHKVAYVYRNPRNVLISSQRYQNHQMRGWEDTITDEKLINQFFDFYNSSMPAVYASYSKWLLTSAYCFKFEDMLAGPEVMHGLADYLGKPRLPSEKYKDIPGPTPTWTGKLSDWRQFWTDGIDKIWVGEGMLEVEKSLGYDNTK
jgi:hypothetical protein